MAQGRYDNSREVNETLFALTNHFADIEEIEELTDSHCQVIALSHFLRNIVITLPTIIEIISSGQLAIISDQALKTAIANYTLDMERNATTYESAARDINRLSFLFPELVKLDPIDNSVMSGASLRSAQCDFEGMATNLGFQNELINNNSRQELVTRQFPQQLALLTGMHFELDRLLDITHRRQTP